MRSEDRSKQKKTANKLELWLATQLGGRRVPNSGALSGWKGDVELSLHLLDSKYTNRSVQSIKVLDLIKITREARDAGKDSGHLVLSYLSSGIIGDHWAVLPYRDCAFSSSEELLIANRGKSIGLTYLSGVTKRSVKEGTIPSVKIYFENIALGTPKYWLIIPFTIYKDKFGEVNE